MAYWRLVAEQVLGQPQPWQALLVTVTTTFGLILIFSLLVKGLFTGGGANNVLVLTASIAFAFCLAEIILFSFGVGDTYLEKRGNGRPVDVNYQRELPWTWDTNGTHRLKTSVFDYPRTTNRFGLSDNEWPDSTSSFRILVLGDSFTEGDGAPYDSSWVALIREPFKEDSINVELLNAGLCGSDPYEQLKLYTELLAPLNPDMIILCTSTTDFTWDGMQRGGIERFSRHGHHISILEALYAYSRVARLILEVFWGYNDLLFDGGDHDAIEPTAKFLAEDIIERFSTVSNTPIAVVMFPHAQELTSGYAYSLDITLTNACNEFPNTKFYSSMDCYDSTMTSKKFSAKELWWIPEDGHHRPKGYAMMADCIYENIRIDVEKAIATKQ